MFFVWHGLLQTIRWVLPVRESLRQTVSLNWLPQELPEDLPPREDFFAVVRAGFGQRRKTMLNSLSAGLRWEKDATRALLTAAGIAENARAEQVTLEQWKALTRAYFSMKKSR